MVVLAALKEEMTNQDRIAGGQARHVKIPTSSLPARRSLLTQDTTKGWGNNCVRYGAGCRYFAHTVLGADVIPIDDVHRNGFLNFDLVGIFNILDHTTFPLEVIRKSLELSDKVLVVTHNAIHAGKQHLFAFGDDFAGWLDKSLEEISVEDLYSEVDAVGVRDYNYILLSKKIGSR